MKVKLDTIQGAQAALRAIANTPLPVKTAYRLSRITSKLDSQLKEIEKIRVELVHKYGVINEKTKSTDVPEDKKETFYNELSKALEQEVELDAWNIPLSLIQDCKLSPAQITTLESFIVDDTVEVMVLPPSPKVTLKSGK